jgi:hypothetical protein
MEQGGKKFRDASTTRHFREEVGMIVNLALGRWERSSTHAQAVLLFPAPLSPWCTVPGAWGVESCAFARDMMCRALLEIDKSQYRHTLSYLKDLLPRALELVLGGSVLGGSGMRDPAAAPAVPAAAVAAATASAATGATGATASM